jgi:hypothetical protein
MIQVYHVKTFLPIWKVLTGIFHHHHKNICPKTGSFDPSTPKKARALVMLKQAALKKKPLAKGFSARPCHSVSKAFTCY